MKQKQLRAPAASGAVGAVFVRLHAEEQRGHDARNRGFGLGSCCRGLVFPRETLQAQSAEDWCDWCSHRGTLQTQRPNEATDGLEPSVSGSFLGAVRAASHDFPPACKEEPRRATAG